MPAILVRALRDFDFAGLTAQRGEILEVTPVQAAILGRAHHFNLSERNLVKPAAVAPDAAPPAPSTRGRSSRRRASGEAGQPTAPRKRGVYARRDMRAEP
jgi:hypothetical protein